MARVNKARITGAAREAAEVTTSLEVAPGPNPDGQKGKSRKPAGGRQGARSGRAERKTSPEKGQGNGKKSPPAGRGKQAGTANRRTRRQPASPAAEAPALTPEAERAAQAVCEPEQRLQAILQQAEQATGQLRQALREAKQELQAAREEAEAVKAQSRQAVEEFEQATHFLSTARQDSQVTRQQLQEAEQSLRALSAMGEQARQGYREAEEAALAARQELEEVWQRARQATAEVRAARDGLPVTEGLYQPAGEPGPECSGEVWEASSDSRLPPSSPVIMPNDVMPAEDAHDRLVRYLNDAWAVEKALVKTLQTMSDEVTNEGLRGLLREQAQVTHDQQLNLEIRLRELGKEPSGGKGFFDQMLTRIWDAMSRPRDGADHTLHDLMKGLGAGHFQIAMYQALEAYAGAVGDEETANLAGEHLRQEEEATDRLRPFLAPAVAHAVSTPEA